MTRNTSLAVAVIAILAALSAVYFFYDTKERGLTVEGQACAADAKICPDGTAVSRIPPNCQFAACPAATSTGTDDTSQITVTAQIGKSVVAMGETLTLTTLVEDSRCPADVQCIWAGTVQVRGTLKSGMGSADVTFELGKQITTEANGFTLVEVTPVKSSGGEISPQDYRFVFQVVRR